MTLFVHWTQQKVLHEKCDIESLDRMRDLFKHNLAFCEKVYVVISAASCDEQVKIILCRRKYER